jgi:Cid1 family poly A polymerase
MIINFLQTRDPPVLPALQQNLSLQKKVMSGLDVAFDKNIASYEGYGSLNKDSLGVLLFQFFRYYGHEIDFETSVISVRAGKVITKLEKNWHFLQDNRLCVEEPFNTSRNLGNTADDTSVRGIHLELRRAFKMVSQGDLAKCCVEYEPPANFVDETRPLERHNTSASRPTLAQPAATLGRVGRGGGRGGRHNNQSHRISNAGRRPSGASTRAHAFSQPLPLGGNVTPTDLTLQAQQQQSLLHDRLFQQYQLLQAQEQELRAQLNQQAVLQGRVVPTSTYPYFLLPYGSCSSGQEEFMRARAGSINQPPLTAPIRPQGFSFPTSFGGRGPTFGSTTNPSSPLLHTVVPEVRRTYRRSSFTNGPSAGSLRAQSQPPRPLPSPLSFPGAVDRHSDQMHELPYNSRRTPAHTSGNGQEFADALTAAQGRLYQNPNTDRRGSEYIGYYLGHSPPLPIYSRSVISSPSTSSTGLGIQNCGISPQILAQLPSNPLSIPSLPSEFARPPLGERKATKAESLDDLPLREAPKRPVPLSRSSSGPVVVHGSVDPETERRQSNVDLDGSLNATNFDTSASDDIAVETPTSSDDSSQGIPESQIVGDMNPSKEAPRVIAAELSTKQKGSRITTRGLNGHTNLPVTHNDLKQSHGTRSLENQPLRVNGTTPARETAGTSDAEVLQSDEKQIQSRALRLSPVKEVLTPSPTQHRQLSLVDESVHEPSKSKMKGKAKSKKSSLSSVGPSEDKQEALAAQPNGLMSGSRALKSPNNTGVVSGWQTQKKKPRHKKGSKSETDVKGGNAVGGEFLPLDESLRKGG